jgi:hypothetical protein
MAAVEEPQICLISGGHIENIAPRLRASPLLTLLHRLSRSIHLGQMQIRARPSSHSVGFFPREVAILAAPRSAAPAQTPELQDWLFGESQIDAATACRPSHRIPPELGLKASKLRGLRDP